MADPLVVPESAKNNFTAMTALAIEGAASLEKYANKMDEKTKDFIDSFVKTKMRFSSFCRAVSHLNQDFFVAFSPRS